MEYYDKNHQPRIINTEMNVGMLQSPDEQKYMAGISTFNRWGATEDVADIAVFIASSYGRWVTGNFSIQVEDLRYRTRNIT